jgi:hypothetical protein
MPALLPLAWKRRTPLWRIDWITSTTVRVAQHAHGLRACFEAVRLSQVKRGWTIQPPSHRQDYAAAPLSALKGQRLAHPT